MKEAIIEMTTTRRLREIVRMLCGSVSSETGDDYVVDGDDDYMEDDGVDGGRSFVRGEVGRGVGRCGEREEMWGSGREIWWSGVYGRGEHSVFGSVIWVKPK